MRRPSSSLAVVLTSLLMLRAMVPLGFMPVMTDGGSLQLVICTGAGANYAVPAADEQAPPPSGEHAAETAICPMGGLAVPFLMSTPAEPAWQPPPTIVRPGIDEAADTRTTARPPALGARAPPVGVGASA